MARARNIKPSFFENDELGQCSPLSRLLFIHLWTVADREGRLEDRPLRIKATGLPYDNCDVDALLNELHKSGFIKRYSVNGVNLIWVVNFTKHQNPHPRENDSVLAEYCEAVEINGESRKETARNASSPFPLIESPILNPDVTQQAAPKPMKAKSNANYGTSITTALGENPILPSEWANFPSCEFRWSQERINSTFAKFVDYWRGRSGAGGRKADWTATWRNWCRADEERSPRGASQTGRGMRNDAAAVVSAVVAKRYGTASGSQGVSRGNDGMAEAEGENSDIPW